MRRNASCIFFFYLLVITNITFSQNTTPFSSLIPIGELSDNSFANNLAMGGLGISNGSYWHINNQNPAALVNNRFTTFEMGIASDIRQVINQRSKDNIGDGNLNYIGFAIPVFREGKWTTSFGFNPYSKMSYKLLSEDIVNNIDGSSTSTLVTHEYNGDGGLTEIYFSNGIKLLSLIHI